MNYLLEHILIEIFKDDKTKIRTQQYLQLQYGRKINPTVKTGGPSS